MNISGLLSHPPPLLSLYLFRWKDKGLVPDKHYQLPLAMDAQSGQNSQLLYREAHVWILSWLCKAFSLNSSLTWWNLVPAWLRWPALISYHQWHSPKPFAVRMPLILCGVWENSSSPATFCYLHGQWEIHAFFLPCQIFSLPPFCTNISLVFLSTAYIVGTGIYQQVLCQI